ncbi:MAG: RNA polymerase sigma-70 factor (ECF subfamily) [Flavobacteriales bacterium]|jgi:RNA polymerase sigma-70 factor (ECF subfamily)
MQNSQFVQEFNSTSSFLKHFALKLTRDKSAADDLFQETALRAFRYREKYIADTNFKAWTSTMMRNLFINHYRRNKKRNEVQDNTKDDYYINQSTESIVNDGETNINVQEILKLIDSLDEGYRTPFLMAYKGYKYDEIQEAMNLPLGTIKSKIHHARKILKRRYNKMLSEVAA